VATQSMDDIVANSFKIMDRQFVNTITLANVTTVQLFGNMLGKILKEKKIIRKKVQSVAQLLYPYC